MSWLDWFRRRKLERASAAAISFVPSAANYYGPGAAHQPATDVLLRENLGIADAATRAIANRLASLQIQVTQDKRTQAGTLETEVLDDHPLVKLLARPHPNISYRQLMRLTAQWIVGAGEAYWLKVGNGFQVPVELHPWPPSMIEPLVDRGVVTGYRITDGDGAQFTRAPDTVIRIYFPDPENPWRAEGYVGPSAIALDAHRFALEHLRSFYQFDATPKIVLEGDADAPAPPKPGTPEGDRYWSRWAADYQRRAAGETQGIPRPVSPGWKAHELKGGVDEAMKGILEYGRDELLMTMGGVPRSVLGQVVSGDRSSAEVNQWVFDMYAVLPIADLVSDSVTLQLASDFEGDVRVGFAPFLAPDKAYELAKEKQDVELAVRTINQVRVDREDDEVEWGEKPVMSTKLKVFDPDAEPMAEVVPIGEPPDASPEEEDRAERREHAAVRAKYSARKRKRTA